MELEGSMIEMPVLGIELSNSDCIFYRESAACDLLYNISSSGICSCYCNLLWIILDNILMISV